MLYEVITVFYAGSGFSDHFNCVPDRATAGCYVFEHYQPVFGFEVSYKPAFCAVFLNGFSDYQQGIV